MDTRPATPEFGSSAPAGQHLDLTWLRPLGMVALSFVNFFYRLLTLGIYDFWARTEVRKRLWSSIRIDGEPLSYTGTGKELFLGFLIVFGVVLLPILIITFAAILLFSPQSPVAAIIQLLVYVAVFFLFGVGVYRAQRYRLHRTNWRGIRGSLEGNSWNYGWTYFWTMLLIPVTLGWIVPWRTTKLQSLITNDAKFGDQPFAFRGDAGPLYGPFALLWFGVMVLFIGSLLVIGAGVSAFQQTLGSDALGADGELRPEFAQLIGFATLAVIAVAYLFYLMISAWYRARTINHFARCTHFDNAAFSSRVTGLGLLWIDMSNIAILVSGTLLVLIPLGLVLTLAGGALFGLSGLTPEELSDPQTAGVIAGVLTPILFVVIALSFTLFLPVTQARAMGYLISHLSLEGTVAVHQIAQSEAGPMTTGEGLAQAFDVDAF